jgi:hypothetical protein
MNHISAIPSVVVVAFVVAIAGCNFSDGIVFYEVVREREEECLIRQNGEFCVEPEQFDPPSVEVWSVEERESATLLYVDEEVWIMDALPEDADDTTPRRAEKTSIVTDGSTGCVSERKRSVSFVADGETFDGELAVRAVLTGPVACGNTPAGERSIDSVEGGVSGP